MQEWQEKIEQEVEHLKQEMKQLREQRTEEMKAINVNVASKDVIDRIDKLEQDMNVHAETWLNTVQENYNDHKQDISGMQQTLSDVQTVQKGHLKFFEAHGKRLETTATKDDLSRIEVRLETTATKDDIASMTSKDDLKQSLDAFEDRLLTKISQMLQQKPEGQ
jgi:hypothetical protein